MSFQRWVALPFAVLLGVATGIPPATVSYPWFRLITPRVPAAGYMSLHNTSGHEITFIGARSAACGMLMLHRTEGERMLAVPAVAIPPGGTLTLAPGGYHLMCMTPRMKLGTSVPVTLLFQDGATTVDAPIVEVPVLGARDHPPGGN